jgi:hypothetical protein
VETPSPDLYYEIWKMDHCYIIDKVRHDVIPGGNPLETIVAVENGAVRKLTPDESQRVYREYRSPACSVAELALSRRFFYFISLSICRKPVPRLQTTSLAISAMRQLPENKVARPVMTPPARK